MGTGLDEIIALSRRYGADPAWVLAGGGNTSFKDASTMWVKASGSPLAGIDASGFCAIDRARLDAIWSRTYPAGTEAREAAALEDLMAARLPGVTKRPSVETLLHGFFPQAYVVHTHPGLVNGLSCGRKGEEAFRELFGETGAWVGCVDPGYTLAKAVKEAVDAFRAKKGAFPALLFMQNHGLLVAAEDPAGIAALSDSVVARLGARLGRSPDRSLEAVDPSLLAAAAAALSSLAAPGTLALHRADHDILAFAGLGKPAGPLAGALSPDHIVYAGHEFLHAPGPEALAGAWKAYEARNGSPPRIVLVGGAGAFALGHDSVSASTALALFLDACAVAVYAESFGGVQPMAEERVRFIRNWEVERYRAAASLGAAKAGE